MNQIRHDLYIVDPYQEKNHQDQWDKLKQFTDARIAIGRAGCSIPTKAMLDFQLAHAQARDAVYQILNVEELQQKLHSLDLDSLTVQSQAVDKQSFLKRPDLGRLLDQNSQDKLITYQQEHKQSFDVCIVLGDGLSALAIEENAIPLIQSLLPHIHALNWTLAPIVIAQGSRVALGDEVAERLNVKMMVMLIGERPGLSSPDSMGVYYTWQATSGCLESKRNCISNIRPAGLSIHIATQRLINLMQKSAQLGYSGVKLKDEHVMEILEQDKPSMTLF